MAISMYQLAIMALERPDLLARIAAASGVEPPKLETLAAPPEVETPNERIRKFYGGIVESIGEALAPLTQQLLEPRVQAVGAAAATAGTPQFIAPPAQPGREGSPYPAPPLLPAPVAAPALAPIPAPTPIAPAPASAPVPLQVPAAQAAVPTVVQPQPEQTVPTNDLATALAGLAPSAAGDGGLRAPSPVAPFNPGALQPNTLALLQYLAQGGTLPPSLGQILRG
jgi:hypothetical protein